MSRASRIGWIVFALHVVGVLVWAEVVNRRHPEPRASAQLGSDGVRFGKTLEERKRLFAELVRGEPQDRAQAATRREGEAWNRNNDSHFHELERNRVPGVAARFGVPAWMAWWILDEGLRNHWPPPPGVVLYADDAPLAQKTRPLTERHKIAEGTP